MLDKGSVQSLDQSIFEGGVRWYGCRVQGVLLDDMQYRGEKLVHALSIAASLRVQFTVHEKDVEDHGLGFILMVRCFVWKSLDILEDLGADNLILTNSVPGGLGLRSAV